MLSRHGHKVALDAPIQRCQVQSRLEIDAETEAPGLDASAGPCGLTHCAAQGEDDRAAHAEMREQHLAEFAAHLLFCVEQRDLHIAQRQSCERPWPCLNRLYGYQSGHGLVHAMAGLDCESVSIAGASGARVRRAARGDDHSVRVCLRAACVDYACDCLAFRCEPGNAPAERETGAAG